MTLSFLQLNINADNYWDKLIPFLASHDFDVMQFQELTGKETLVGNIHSTRDTFNELQKILAEKYYGELSITQRFTSNPDSYIGNGIFYRKSFSLVEKQSITISEFEKFFPSDSKQFQRVGRALLHLVLKIEEKEVSFINTHFAWGENNIEKPFQTEQGKTLINYLKQVSHPFIFSADLNLTPDSTIYPKT